MISRMYVGMHYLGDVLLGLILGLIISVGFNMFYNRTNLKEELLKSAAVKLFLLAPITLILLSSVLPGFQGGTLIGLNLALLLILVYWGEPVLVSALSKRIINSLIFVVLYFGMYFLTKKLHLPKEGLLSMLAFALFNFVTLLLFYFVGKKVGVYKQQSA